MNDFPLPFHALVSGIPDRRAEQSDAEIAILRHGADIEKDVCVPLTAVRVAVNRFAQTDGTGGVGIAVFLPGVVRTHFPRRRTEIGISAGTLFVGERSSFGGIGGSHVEEARTLAVVHVTARMFFRPGERRFLLHGADEIRTVVTPALGSPLPTENFQSVRVLYRHRIGRRRILARITDRGEHALERLRGGAADVTDGVRRGGRHALIVVSGNGRPLGGRIYIRPVGRTAVSAASASGATHEHHRRKQRDGSFPIHIFSLNRQCAFRRNTS